MVFFYRQPKAFSIPTASQKCHSPFALGDATKHWLQSTTVGYIKFSAFQYIASVRPERKLSRSYSGISERLEKQQTAKTQTVEAKAYLVLNEEFYPSIFHFHLVFGASKNRKTEIDCNRVVLVLYILAKLISFCFLPKYWFLYSFYSFISSVFIDKLHICMRVVVTSVVCVCIRVFETGGKPIHSAPTSGCSRPLEEKTYWGTELPQRPQTHNK